MKYLRKLLFPFSALYYAGIWLRNFFFDKGFFYSRSYNFPLLCVGNLSTGGTGKTPMTEYLIRLLKDKTSLGVLSRGYGRITKGYIKVNGSYDAISVGDEPLQYATKFDAIEVAVCEDRITGIKALRDEQVSPAVILLDDAFQHRKVTPGFSVLLTSYSELFYEDYVLPSGNLRDVRHQARRADAIVVTKCPPTLAIKEKNLIRANVARYADSPVYFAAIQYNDYVYGGKNRRSLSIFEDKQVTLVTGIANPDPLLTYLNDQNITYTHKRYRDHYNFTSDDIEYLKQCSCILTTEKDYMRLSPQLPNQEVYYIPIKTVFLENDGALFDKSILDFTAI